jgi:hypothetical protein
VSYNFNYSAPSGTQTKVDEADDTFGIADVIK